MAIKLILSTLFLFCSFSPYVLAQKLPDWEAMYGEGLEKVPYTVRSQFQLSTGRAWHDASFEERINYLDKKELQDRDSAKAQKRYEDEIQAFKKEKAAREKAIADRKQARAKALADKARQREREKVAQDKRLSDIIKARQDAMRALERQRRR